MMKRILGAAAAVAASIALVGTTQATSHAAESGQGAQGAQTTQSCVEWWQWYLSPMIQIDNNCGTTQSVRLVYENHSTECNTLAPGEHFLSFWTSAYGDIEGVRAC